MIIKKLKLNSNHYINQFQNKDIRKKNVDEVAKKYELIKFVSEQILFELNNTFRIFSLYFSVQR